METTLMSHHRLATLVLTTCTAILTTAVVAQEAGHSRTNRLASESSPYLLLHSHNPVDWYPWGPEAFDKAKRENKPIFLSIGYSSCYWCHVMERKVFSDGPIAEYLNQHFVNIKVDREERPDVDDIYMTSLLVYQQLTGAGGGGGWPLSMFLTPDGNPIAGATYLPPDDSPERGPGFLSVAGRIHNLWQERRPDLEHTAGMIAAQVQRLTKPGLELEPVVLNAELLDAAAAQIKAMYDPVWGGVDFNPNRPDGARFPNVPRLELALDLYESTSDPELLTIVEHSLTAMAAGGIRDHLAGGFHRYSTDRRWHVPHFEKMLYDQAMLLGVYMRAARLTGKAEYAMVASEIADFVHREMTTPEGAFCSALDAETNAIEGEYYVWSQQEIKQILGADDAELLARVYGVTEPQPLEHGAVLYLPKPIPEVAETLNLQTNELSDRLAELRGRLLKARSERQRPLLDDKVLTSWNAMMIRALAVSGRELDRPQDTAAATKAAEFLLTSLRDDDGHLLRTWRQGNAKYAAYLDDYAFLTSALLELNAATDDVRWLDEARQLAQLQNELFYDKQLQAFYFTASSHEKLIARTSSAYDSVFPSANSVSIRNLLQLDAIRPSPELREIATSTLTRFAPTLKKAPAGCSGLARALQQWLSTADQASSAAGVSMSEFPHSSFILTGLTAGSQAHKPADERAGESGDEPAAQSTSPDTADAADKPDASDAGHATQNSAAPVVEHTSFKPIAPPETAGPFAKDEKPVPVKVKVYPMYDKLERGGKCLVAVELQIKLGWHVNANPSSPDFLVPTKVTLQTEQKVKLTRIRYPKHHELQVQGFDEPYHVYDGKVLIYGLLEIDEQEKAETAELEFHVTFQGCNSTECLPPDKIVMKGKLPLAAKGATLKKINQSKFPTPEPKGSKTDAKTKPKS
ncbi:MAG: DUF255 domain-containing protein [Fuerstiella sp.]